MIFLFNTLESYETQTMERNGFQNEFKMKILVVKQKAHMSRLNSLMF